MIEVENTDITFSINIHNINMSFKFYDYECYLNLIEYIYDI